MDLKKTQLYNPDSIRFQVDDYDSPIYTFEELASDDLNWEKITRIFAWDEDIKEWIEI